jgi:hypothetical protein
MADSPFSQESKKPSMEASHLLLSGWTLQAETHRPTLAATLSALVRAPVYPQSLEATPEAVFFLIRSGQEKRLGILSPTGVADFEGVRHELTFNGQALLFQYCPLTSENAQALRRYVPWTVPRPLGLRASVGCGDRLGLATPGHIRAVRKHALAPVFAQQSIREMTRTGRSPQQVLDDAMWGVFQEGWRQGYGADADHLKTEEDADRCIEAGFTWFTIDPSAYVDNDADNADVTTLLAKIAALPWADLETTWNDLRRAYLGKTFPVGPYALSFEERTLQQALAKYGAAIAHTVRMYRHIADRMGNRPFELEMSVDETEVPTSPAEHFFVARELARLGVRWISLALRFVGRLEKGVDYIGDLEEFEAHLRLHVAIARTLGPYKLSLHSGSDKFALYPLFARHAGELFHLKTAGTSYLEALRAVAELDPTLFREILEFACSRYETDRATYHVSALLERVPRPTEVSDRDLPALLEHFDTRQVLHVTFGSVLTATDAQGHLRFRDRLLAVLQAHEETHYRMLETHFDRHLSPFDGT